MVSFYTYLFVSIHDRTLRIPMLSLTCLILPIDKVITQTIFVVQFTSRSLSYSGKTLRCLMWHLPQVYICYLLSINYIPFFYRYNMMTNYAFFLQSSDRWGKDLPLLWGYLDICPSLWQFHIPLVTQSELITWVSSGPSWPYALVQLNKDTHHAPLPKERHLGILPQGGTDMTACRRISQLEVCRLLTSGQ